MYHFFIAPEQLSEDSAVILGSDVRHIGAVLRMKPGEKIMVNAGGDWDYLCEIAEIGTEAVQLRILEGRQETRELPVSITLYQGLPKGEKMELIVQKAVELGAARVVPVAMHRSVVRLDEKKAAAGEACYDIALANILAPVILMLEKEVWRHLKIGGIFITSGIIDEKEEEVRAAIAANPHFEVLEVNRQGEWSSVVARRKA